MGPYEALSLLLLAALPVYSQDTITCYGINGDGYTENVQCPGSKACCGVNATCLQNRLCHNPGDPQDVFVRGPCVSDPYDEVECAQICQYDETVVHGGRFPRVSICDDGSYCCSNDPDCCDNGTGAFLDNRGVLIDSASATSVPPSTAGTATDATFFFSTSADTAAPTSATDSESESSDGDNGDGAGTTTAVKVGVGLGVPLAAILGGLAVWLFLKKRRKAKNDEAQAQNGLQQQQQQPSLYPPQSDTYSQYGSPMSSQPQSMAYAKGGTSHNAPPVYEIGTSERYSEMENTEVRHHPRAEMG